MRLRTRQPDGRPSPTGIAISLALHIVLVVALARITFGTSSLFDWLDRDSRPVAERVDFVTVSGGPSTAPTAGRRGGDGRPIREDLADPPPLVAPAEPPAALPAAEAGTEPPRETGGRGPLIGGGGALRGLQPVYADPRLWQPLDDLVLDPKTVRERVDSSIVASVEQYLDSLAAIPAQRAPDDWTFERGGKKWGVDREYIRLGDVSIPTSVLALLPLNVQGNPIALEREKAYDAQRSDIQYHVQREIGRDEVRAAVQRIRKRVEAERAARAKLAQRGPVRPDPP